MTEPVKPDDGGDEEFGTLGELLDAYSERTTKKFLGALADLLDIGADDSGNPDPSNPPTPKNDPPGPKSEPVTAKRRISFL